MYQVTFIRFGILRTVSTPSEHTAAALRNMIPRSRLWHCRLKGQPQLIR